jgi:hypothetical protein
MILIKNWQMWISNLFSSHCILESFSCIRHHQVSCFQSMSETQQIELLQQQVNTLIIDLRTESSKLETKTKMYVIQSCTLFTKWCSSWINTTYVTLQHKTRLKSHY